jgi:asparagine synthase (glutamine-hydrolysing)
MCGIAGFWMDGPSGVDPLEILKRMGNSIAYRGPDDSGRFFDPATGLGLMHRRLSIIDLSVAGHQPMSSESGRYLIVFNGEVYNFEEIRNEIGERRWRGHSDTEVMLEAIERWGLDAAVGRFVGMFAFALWDRKEGALHLVRDRLGVKPLYYGRVGCDFVFASELKAIRKFPGFSADIDLEALALFMRHNYIPTPHSIYRGINKLKPGCILSLRAGAAPEVRSYWSAGEMAAKGLADQVQGSDFDVIEELHRRLLSAVGLRMIADVPLGAFLSGGIDSTAVVALMQAQSSRPVKTFTIGFGEDSYDEATNAKKVANYLKTEHTELYVTPQEALDVVPLLPAMYDEPFADSSQIPTFLVSKLARRSVTVSLSGDGGDELFGGYDRYFLAAKLWRGFKRVPRLVRKLASGIINVIPTAVFDAAYRGAQPFIPKATRLSGVGDKAHKMARLFQAGDPESMYLSLISQFDRPSELVLGSGEPDTVVRAIRDSATDSTIEQMMMLVDLRTYLPDDILTKVDRASMAVGLEARVPLLDHRIVEFALRIPMDLKIHGGVGKWILRQVLYKYVPQPLVERPKMGFAVPIKEWLRGPLRDWAEALLSEKELNESAILNVKAIRKKWDEHVSGQQNWQSILWSVLMFQGWYASQKQAASGLVATVK